MTGLLVGASVWFLLAACSNAAGKTVLEDFTQEVSLAPDSPTQIYVIELDVTQDGNPELFMAAPVLGGAYGLDWGVYSPQTDGGYKRLGFITFHYESFYYSSTESLFSAYIRLSAALGGYTRYQVGLNGFTELSEQPDDAAEARRVAEWKLKGRPKLYSAALSDIRSPQAVVWREVATDAVGPNLGHLDGTVME